MKPASFEYHAPTSLADAVALLGTLEDARVLAGGQSLVPMMAMRYVVTDHLVDLNRIDELAFVREEGDGLVIGAMTRQRTLRQSEVVRRRAPVLAEALSFVGHFQTRNRGTIGGSLCHLDPSAEIPTVCALLDATLVVTGPSGRREIAAADWTLAYMTPALEPGEILTEIRLPAWPAGHGYAFTEFARRHGDFAIVGCGVLVDAEPGDTIRRAAIAFGGVDVKPVRLAEAEAMLVGRRLDEATITAAAAIAGRIDAMSDAYVTAAYRQRLARVLLGRALGEAARRLGGMA